MENPEADTGNNVDNGNSPPDKQETAMETVMQAQRFPHLLELIGQRMDVEDLWKLRQTCLTWNKEFVPALRDQQNPVLLSCDWKDVIVPALENATTNRSHSSDIASTSPPNFLPKPSLRSYTDTMISSKAIPIAKYKLIDINSKPSRLVVLADFFQLCGTYITHLELWVGGTYNYIKSEDSSLDIGSLRQIIFHQVPNLKDLLLALPYLEPDTPTLGALESPAILTRDLPQLRKLSFSVIPVGDAAFNGLHSMYRSLLTSLLRSTTRLHTLEFGSGHGECSTLEAIRLVREVMSEKQVSKIKTLKIHAVRVPHLEILLDLAGRDHRKNPLRLKSFFTSIVNNLYDLDMHMVNFDVFNETSQLLFRFLQSQADTLLELNFNNTIMTLDIFPEHLSTIDFPIMPAVRNLSLELMGNSSDQLATPLDISFPSLVKYNYLNTIEYQFGDDMDGFEFLAPSLTDLSLETNQYTKGASFLHFSGFRFRFQTITQLKIKLYAYPTRYINDFKQICATMQVLEELDITVYPNHGVYQDGPHLDSLLTGVPIAKLGHLERVLDNLGQIGPTSVPVLQRFLSEYYKMEPGIQDLRCLKRFVMTIPFTGYRLTDIGGYFGLACASHTLQHITITGAKERRLPVTPRVKVSAGVGRRSQVGRLSESCCAGNLVSVECEEMIRSVMSPPKILCFY